ncbi:hypothetical protein Mapa_005124 [Marchantia paleacea]|nr:hypothetical protein Mapa_005124 [Marchantia paleacea]
MRYYQRRRRRKRACNYFFNTKYALWIEKGDHVYVYRNFNAYSHQGIVAEDGKSILHNVADRKMYKCNNEDPETIIDVCPIYYGDRKCGIIKTCIPCFMEGRNLHKYGYGNRSYSAWTFDGGSTTTLERDSSVDAILKRGNECLRNNNFGEFELQYNNCEDFAVYCSTGLKGMSNQSKRWGYGMNIIKHVPYLKSKVKSAIP